MYGGDRSIDMDCCDDGRSSSTQESTELFTESDAETSRLKGARDIPPSGSENEKKEVLSVKLYNPTSSKLLASLGNNKVEN